MESHIEPNDMFVISKDYLMTENEEIEFLSFYDVSKKSSHTITTKDGKVYICLKMNNFGSVFFGNYAYQHMNTLIIQEIDPVLFLVNVIYITTKVDEDKFSTNDFDSIIYKYIETLANKNIDEGDVESTKKFLAFLGEYFKSKPQEIEKICERTFSIKILTLDSFTEKEYYKLNISKILSFMNRKASSEDMRKSASILSCFLHEELLEFFLKFKGKGS
jgi:hypothetical protein